MSLLKRITSIAAFIETAYAEAFTKSDDQIGAAMLYCYDLDFSPAMEVLRRNIYRSSLGQTAPMTGARSAQITLTSEVMGDGVAGSLPPVDNLLRICGFNVHKEVGRCVAYEPKDPTGSDNLYSGSIVLYQDTLKHILTGCRGTFTLNCEAGQIASLAFTIDAMDFTFVDNTGGAPTPTALPTNQPPVVVSAGFAVGSPNLGTPDGDPWSGVVIPAISIDMNNTIARGQSINTASGYKSVEITGRAPTGTMSPEAVLIADHPFYTDWINGKKSDLLWIVGSSAGNRCIISVPAAYYTEMSFEDRDGILAHPTPFDVCLPSDEATGTADSGSDTTIVDTTLFDDGTNDNACQNRIYVGRRVTMGYATANGIDGEVAIITKVDDGTNLATVTPAFTAAVAAGDPFTISNKEIQILFY